MLVITNNSNAGISAIIRKKIFCLVFAMYLPLKDANAASIIIVPNLTASAGWKDNGPILTHLVAPFTSRPRPVFTRKTVKIVIT